jgi:CubicO group peptidase (beta-lactamase class C family)
MTVEGKGVVHLGNWREPPYNRRAFSRVRELIPTANIEADRIRAMPLERAPRDLKSARFALRDGTSIGLSEYLDHSFADGFMMLKAGQVAAEWWRSEETKRNPHIVFSISKSITAILAGIFAGRGLIDPEAPVVRYIPEAKDSAYGDATLRHILDMTISIDFAETYLDPESVFALYRRSTGWNPPQPEPQTYLHEFLLTLKKASREHGERFHYVSPNSDLLGWILERAGGAPLAELLSLHIWKPMGAAFDAYVTVDPRGAPRSAGGICVMLEDLARFGEMMRSNGVAMEQQVAPRSWIEDIRTKGDPEPWQKGDMLAMLPKGNYRSKWYNVGAGSAAFFGAGIHGQWIYIDPAAEMVIAQQSSQPLPADQALDHVTLDVFEGIAHLLTS